MLPESLLIWNVAAHSSLLRCQPLPRPRHWQMYPLPQAPHPSCHLSLVHQAMLKGAPRFPRRDSALDIIIVLNAYCVPTWCGTCIILFNPQGQPTRQVLLSFYTGVRWRYFGFSSRPPQQSKYLNKASRMNFLVSPCIYMDVALSRHENDINLILHLHRSSWVTSYIVNGQ